MKIFAIGAELRLKKSLDIVENYMTEALEGRKEAPSDDLLSRFMKKRDIDGNLFPNTVLKRIALNFVLAGRDTSSVALSWFFWSVMTNPHVEYKILDEITTILRETRGENPKLWTEEPLAFDEADRLVYLKAALAETLRGEYMACSLADEQCDDHRREGTQLNECLNEITRALLQADVQFKLVRDMQTNIKKTVNLDDLAARHNKRFPRKKFGTLIRCSRFSVRGYPCQKSRNGNWFLRNLPPADLVDEKTMNNQFDEPGQPVVVEAVELVPLPK
ncbi:Cytochrome P450 86A1 [Camellia lanceoleosa]|uniref:Cytochrome P450 86A1 n=1 Tax=Camellia lanceoleosa TaxID=1840588 RepID=A0ACC0J1Q9_9ERIC|nr:Cytochrome P450 86A1 [Camellia lanceoleosa]